MVERLTFAIGEIAIYVNPDSGFYGNECTVISSLVYGPVRKHPESCEVVGAKAYNISAPWLPKSPRATVWVAMPEHLRKRPPKQDWNSLCNLKEVDNRATV